MLPLYTTLPKELEDPVSYSSHEYNQIVETAGTREQAEQRGALAKQEIQRICERLELNEATEKTAHGIYESSLSTDLINNYSIGDLTAAAVYTACRDQAIARTVRDIIAASRVRVSNGKGKSATASTRVVNRLYKKICDRLGRSYLPIDAEKFAHRYCAELDLDSRVQQFVEVALEQVNESATSGTDPKVLAVGAIAYAMDEYEVDMTLATLSSATATTEEPVRRSRDLIKNNLG